MNRLDYFRRQFRYEHWANSRVLDSLEEQDVDGTKQAGLIAHILISQGAWLARMDGLSTEGWDLFPKFTLEQSRMLLEKNRGKFDELFARLTEERLDKSRHYRNTMGEEFSSTYDAVFSHLLVHGAHHRGQIATLMRLDDKEPARTDYIFYDRGSA